MGVADVAFGAGARGPKITRWVFLHRWESKTSALKAVVVVTVVAVHFPSARPPI